MKTADLHTHSVYSDGTLTPSQLVSAAEEAGLSAVALCDHNNVDGLPEFLRAAEGKKLEAIAGTEFSVNHNGRELHLLALFIPEKHFSTVAQLTAPTLESKRQSNINLIASLNKAGYDIDYDTLYNSTPNGNFNRAHVATALMEKGYVKSVSIAIDTVLSPSAGHYKEPDRLDFFETLSFIREIGAVSVLAHPFLNLKDTEIENLLPEAKERGLVGMECLYSLYSNETTRKAVALADKFGLCYSGGSDFHGDKKPDIKLGTGKGNLEIPYSWAISLKAQTEKC